jgi:ribonuclease P/MRP protein subunit POP5
MKILPPTLRESKRYIAFSLVAEDALTRNDLLNEVMYSAASLLGDVGSSVLGLRLLSFENNRGIIKCTADRVWESRAILACVSSIRGTRVRISILGVSGTVLAATEKYLLTQNKTDAELDREKTINIKECKIVFDKSIVFGSIVNKNNDEIDLLSEDPQYKKIFDRSNTKYLGMTVFDLENKEID